MNTRGGRRGSGVPSTRKMIPTIHLSDNLERVTSVYCKEIADIDLPERELLNYEVIVQLVPDESSFVAPLDYRYMPLP